MANKNTFFRTMGKCPIVGTEAGPELHVQEISVYVTAKELRNVSSNGSDKKVMDLPLYITGQTENLKQVFGGAVNPTKDGDVLINASVWGKDAERAEAAAAKNSARRIYVKVCGAIRVNVFQKQDGSSRQVWVKFECSPETKDEFVESLNRSHAGHFNRELVPPRTYEGAVISWWTFQSSYLHYEFDSICMAYDELLHNLYLYAIADVSSHSSPGR